MAASSAVMERMGYEIRASTSEEVDASLHSDSAAESIALSAVDSENGDLRGAILAIRAENTGSWWRVIRIAVDPDYGTAGIGSALLKALIRKLPRTCSGLFGSVPMDGPLQWFHHRGFHLSPHGVLVSSTGPAYKSAVAIEADPESYIARSEISTLLDYAAGRLHPKWELRFADRELDREINLTQNLRSDTGYRTMVPRVIARATASCIHVSLGPRPTHIAAFDPQPMLRCLACMSEHSSTVSDVDDLICDGCGKEGEEWPMAIGVDREQRIIVMSALCPDCRAGNIPAEDLA